MITEFCCDQPFLINPIPLTVGEDGLWMECFCMRCKAIYCYFLPWEGPPSFYLVKEEEFECHTVQSRIKAEEKEEPRQ
tara:strand:- start:321 stop:554 length:234 start_codon:yes stop_codon:yes gene_type:complete